MVDNCNEPEFDYQGKHCGIATEIENYKYKFTMWFGEDQIKDYTDVDTLMSDPFFDGHSLNDILPEVEVWF